MSCTRVALGALISVVVLAVAGCDDGPTAAKAAKPSWHAGGSGTGAVSGQGGDPVPRQIGNQTGQDPSGSPVASPSASASTSASPQPSVSTSASTSTSPSAPPSNPIIRTTGSAAVALTFDDGPGPDTPKLLAMLRQQGIKATFCLIGVNAQEYPQYVQEIVKDGHTLCNHTWKHDESLGKKSPDVIRADLQRTNDEIRKAVPGAQIKYFRHPAGNFTPTAIKIAKDLGMESLGWSVDPSDWNVKKWSGAKMTEHIVANVRNNTKPGSIVLSHDGGGDRSATMAAYKTLLPELKAKFTLIAMPV